MDLALLHRQSDGEWWIVPFGNMRVPAVIYASEALMRDMDHKVYEQVTNVAMLPGIVRASYAMPDAQPPGQFASALFQTQSPVFGRVELLADLCTQHGPSVFRD